MEFDLEDPLASFEEQQNCSISELFACESDHMPAQNCISFRCEAVSLISQVQFSCNLDPFGAYLARNYLDRFVSRQEIKQGKPWFLRLVAMSCLSLASKMTNTPFSISDLQIEGCMFEARSIQKMELLILGALEWRMRSITPFSFLHFFISLTDLELKDPSTKQALKERASEVIFNVHYGTYCITLFYSENSQFYVDFHFKLAQTLTSLRLLALDIKFLGFKPSIVAASALICACRELFPLQFSAVRASIAACEYIDEETICRCFNLMLEMKRMEADESAFDYDTSVISTETTVSTERAGKEHQKEENLIFL
ncbi:putative cyclin-D6-1 isoform X1 [Prosopis cineraria]|uniref:putative cyclin-D6-1 isoform X1 n=1 Tax=Prosopis cineraria TaxID=364024 RepID=UPI0024108286|nr:putative cyclin-D6-1 isoform X1 [Prosopis cineraria]